MSVFDYFINMIQSVLYPLFFAVLIPEKKKYWQFHFLLFWLLHFLFLTFVNSYAVSQGLLFLVTVVMSFFYLRFISEYSLEERLIYCPIPDLIVGVVFTLFSIIMQGIVFPGDTFDHMMETHAMSLTLLATALLYAAFWLCYRLLKNAQFRFTVQESVFICVSLNLCNCMTVCFETVLFDSENYRFYLALGVILVSVLTVLVMYLVNSLSTKNRELYQSQIQLTLYENQKTVAEETIKTRNELLGIRHDLVHLVRILSKEDADKKYQEIMDIMSTYRDTIEKMPAPIKSCSEIIDTVINIKMMDAIEKGIDFRVFMTYSYQPDVPDDDMYLILSNLLDNAIKHIGLAGKMEIYVRDLKDMIGIRITNSIDEPVLDKDGNFLHPTFALEHGLGINMVNQAISLNQGFIMFSEENMEFSVILKLPNRRHLMVQEEPSK